MRIPDLEQMIEDNGPIYHPIIDKRQAVFLCHVCGEPSTPVNRFVTMLWWCEVCAFSAHYHIRCVDYKDRIIANEDT